jgi:hypothetical protein
MIEILLSAVLLGLHPAYQDLEISPIPTASGMSSTRTGWAESDGNEITRYDVYLARSGEGRQTWVRRQLSTGDVAWASGDDCPNVASVMAEFNELPLKIDAPVSSSGERPVMIPSVSSRRWVWGHGSQAHNWIVVTAFSGPVLEFTNRSSRALRDCWKPDAPT